jgi:hypothetical protein
MAFGVFRTRAEGHIVLPVHIADEVVTPGIYDELGEVVSYIKLKKTRRVYPGEKKVYQVMIIYGRLKGIMEAEMFCNAARRIFCIPERGKR